MTKGSCRKGWMKVGKKCLKRKTVKSFVDLYGASYSAVMAISDTYGIPEDEVYPVIDKFNR